MQSYHELVRDILRDSLSAFLEFDSVFSPLETDNSSVLFSVVSNIVINSPCLAASLHVHYDEETVRELLKAKYGTGAFSLHDCIDAVNEICNLTAGKIRATLGGHLPGVATMSLPFVTRAFDELLNAGHPDDQSLRWHIDTLTGKIAAHSRFRVRNIAQGDFDTAVKAASDDYGKAGSVIEML